MADNLGPWDTGELGCRRPYYAYFGTPQSYKGYLNEEFHLFLRGLISEYEWRTVMADKPTNETTWQAIEQNIVRDHGCLPSVLVFVIKFHWDFLNLKHLGPRPKGVMSNTVM